MTYTPALKYRYWGSDISNPMTLLNGDETGGGKLQFILYWEWYLFCFINYLDESNKKVFSSLLKWGGENESVVKFSRSSLVEGSSPIYSLLASQVYIYKTFSPITCQRLTQCSKCWAGKSFLRHSRNWDWYN